MNRIPSDEEFARVSRQMKEQSRNLDRVRGKVIQHFTRICPLHNFFVLAQGDFSFRAYVFFKKDGDIQTCKNSGILQDLIDFVYVELEDAGRGKREDIEVAFEFDSDENVAAIFGGNYFSRLR